jgi:hypothetical protein
MFNDDDYSPPSYTMLTNPPKVRCYSCDKELAVSFERDYYDSQFKATYSCCGKTETLTISYQAVNDNKIPEVWIAFLSDNARIK